MKRHFELLSAIGAGADRMDDQIEALERLAGISVVQPPPPLSWRARDFLQLCDRSEIAPAVEYIRSAVEASAPAYVIDDMLQVLALSSVAAPGGLGRLVEDHIEQNLWAEVIS